MSQLRLALGFRIDSLHEVMEGHLPVLAVLILAVEQDLRQIDVAVTVITVYPVLFHNNC